MKVTNFFACLFLLAITYAHAGTGSTHCQFSPYFQENVTIKTDIANGQLRIDKEASFRVYLKTTMNIPFYDAKLDVLSDQFDATVTPSPTWKSYPDVTQVGAGGSREYFTVALKRKSGVPDGKYDISLKLYSSRRTFRRLAFFLPLSETVDAHTVPVVPRFEIDGKGLASKWGDSALVNNFWAFKQEKSSDGKQLKAGLSSYSPSAQTRIHLTGNADNVFLLAHLFGCGGNDTLKIYVAPEIESKPVAMTLDTTTSKIVSDPPVKGIQCVKCEADSVGGVAVYEIKIPRKALGIDKKNYFYMDFCRTTAGANPDKVDLADNGIESSYWRGNAFSIDDPVVYGKMVIGEAQPPALGASR